ncbi:MAG TPA: hypothetical protein PLN03_13005 [Spirochaetota bacterium]|nr:hypothetical protein [Spirochaetota bacterium]HOK93727.1 hypothetical protein [Spirochaetota bacterium]
MKFYRTWVCRDHRVYQVSQERPVCPHCGKPMFRAPAAAAHLVFPIPPKTTENISRDSIVKQQQPVTSSEIAGAPRITVLKMQPQENETVDEKPKRRGRRKKEE